MEYVVYRMVGEKKYKDFITAWDKDEHPGERPEAVEWMLKRWMQYIGVDKDSYPITIGN